MVKKKKNKKNKKKRKYTVDLNGKTQKFCEILLLLLFLVVLNWAVSGDLLQRYTKYKQIITALKRFTESLFA